MCPDYVPGYEWDVSMHFHFPNPCCGWRHRPRCNRSGGVHHCHGFPRKACGPPELHHRFGSERSKHFHQGVTIFIFAFANESTADSVAPLPRSCAFACFVDDERSHSYKRTMQTRLPSLKPWYRVFEPCLSRLSRRLPLVIMRTR